MDLESILALARKHADSGAMMESSARLCLADAVKAKDDEKLALARGRALRSLSYSVGVFHPDYKRAAK